MRFSIHVLDGANGEHAENVPIEIHSVDVDGNRAFQTRCVTDAGGRSSAEISVAKSIDVTISGGVRFTQTPAAAVAVQAVTIRLVLQDGIEGFHLPTVIAPNSSSLCWLKSDT